MLRTIAAVLFVALFLIFSLPVQGVLWLLGFRFKEKTDMISLRIVQWAFKVVIFISGAKPDIKGLENIPKDRAVLFIANHQSFFDVIITYSLMPNLTGFISKKEHRKIPLLHIWMGRLYCLFLDRDDIRAGLKTILKAVDYVNAGISMFIFPEGSRSKDKVFHEFHGGSFKIATKSGCPIVPIAITGTDDVMENSLPALKKGPVSITFGEPIYLENLSADDKKHISLYTHKVIEEMLKEQRGSEFKTQ